MLGRFFFRVLPVAVVPIAVALTFTACVSRGSAASNGVVAATSPTPSASPTAMPTPLPSTWPAGLQSDSAGTAVLLSCLDVDHDGRLNAGDGPDFAGLDIPLASGKACVDPGKHADFFVGSPSDPLAYTCDTAQPPVLIVGVGSGGSDLLDASKGESMGVLDIVNMLQSRLAAIGVSSEPIFATPAIFGVDDHAQTRMEQWIAHDMARRLDALPCLRAVLIGHSHGGVTVSGVTAALDNRYSGRMYGVMIDRTTVLYDRPATEMPDRTRLLNVFQLNEGWHGFAIDQPNITNVDASHESAPIAPSDGGGPPRLVTHKTIDDAATVQRRIVDAVMGWVAGR